MIELIRETAPEFLIWATILSVFIEITPIKINPITWLLSYIGQKLNSGLTAEIEDIKAQLKEQGEKIDNNEKDRIRYEILDFANSCRNQRKHTKEEYDHILEQYDKYELIMESLGQPNGKVTQAMKYISSLYSERLEKNDFLA